MEPRWLPPPVLDWPLCWDRRVHSLVPELGLSACVPTLTILGPLPVSTRFSPSSRKKYTPLRGQDRQPEQ